MSFLYAQNPQQFSEKTLKRLGVWSTSEYETAIREIGLPDDDMKKCMSDFKHRLQDTHEYCRNLIQIDIKDALKQKGGSRPKRPRYSSSRVASPDFADTKKYRQYNDASFRDTYNELARECANPAIYNINGERLPGNLIDECIRSKTALTPKRRRYHQTVLDAAIECKKAGVTEADLQTCIDTKVGESELVFQLTDQILQNMKTSLIDFEKQNLSFGPILSQEMKEIQSERESWMEWTLRQLKTGSIWTLMTLKEAGYSLANFVIRDPHTAKIVIFIVRAFLSRICRYVYREWLGAFQKGDAKRNEFLEKVKDRLREDADIDFDRAGGVAKLAIEEAIQKFATGDGFDSMWSSMSTLASQTFLGSIGSIPVVGGAVSGFLSGLMVITKESIKFGLEISVYERNFTRSFSFLVDIVYMVMPFEIKLDEQTNKWVFVWFQGGQCSGFQINSIQNVNPAGTQYSPVRVEMKEHLDSLRSVVRERAAEDQELISQSIPRGPTRVSSLPPLY